MKRNLPYPHPGEILQHEFLVPLEVSPYRLAKAIGVPQGRIGQIIAGQRSISADTALRLARYFGTSDTFWLMLQSQYDAAMARDAIGEELLGIEPLQRVA